MRRLSGNARRALWSGLLFAAPAIVGILVFVIYPFFASLYFSFTEYSVLRPPRWVGLANYKTMFLSDRIFWISLYNTAYYVLFSVPLGITVAFGLAMLLNRKVRGIAFYRTAFYLPSIVPLVASSVLWLWLLNPQYGLINTILAYLGIRGPGWFSDPAWAKPALILMSTWSVGGLMIIFLAGLQDIPQEQYEAAEIDGANRWVKFWYITVPFMSPYLLFAVIMGLIGGFQYFTQPMVMTSGGPANATLMLPMYLFQNGFQYFKMGYASAMAWFILAVVSVLTFLIFRTSARRVYYGGM